MRITISKGYSLTLGLLDDIEKRYVNEKERKDIERKVNELIGALKFNDYKDRVLAEKIFKLGYLSKEVLYEEDKE